MMGTLGSLELKVRGYEIEWHIPVLVLEIANEAKILANCIFFKKKSFFSEFTYPLIDLMDKSID